MDRRRVISYRSVTGRFSPLWIAIALGLAQFAMSKQAAAQQNRALPPICRSTSAVEAIRTLIRSCPSGNCIPRAGVGDLLERRVDPTVLERVSSEPALHPVRVFYKRNHGRFDATDTLSRDHYEHVIEDLQEMASGYHDYPGSKIVVLGRASQTGDVATNVHLSQERAQRLADYIHNRYGIPPSAIHQAYFGSQLFQLQAGNLEDLGISLEDVRAAAGSTDSAIIANQSAIAFLFPCPEPLQQSASGANEEPDGSCPYDPDTAPPAHANRPTPAASPPPCQSSLSDGEGGVPTAVYLMGGRLSDLFSQYVQSLGSHMGGRNLRGLTVMYPAIRPDGLVEWQRKSSTATWFTQDLVASWSDTLGNAAVPTALLPSHAGPVDVFCGVNPPQPLGHHSGCGCYIPQREDPADGLPAILSISLGVALARKRRRPRSVALLQT